VSALAGVWRIDGKPQAEADCARMLMAQQIYGPHDSRQWCDGALAMGRRLFRTLPEDVHDRQPLHSRDRRLTLVADVRLDNREDLIAELRLNRAEATQLCDASILLECLDHWGDGAITRLTGDFAFVLWDAKSQRLLLVRDFLGARPLFYHRGRSFFAFASMSKGLHALAEIPYGPDEQLAAEFLVLMPRCGPRSFFRDIARVEPGHIVTVTCNGITSRRYWQPQRPNGGRLRSGEYIEGLRYQLDRATQSRLRGVTGAVATHLSAGLDSSAVTATAARLLASRGGKVVAFTTVPRAGYDGSRMRNSIVDEGSLAGATAAMYPNVEHVLIRSGHQSALEGLDRAVYLFESPVLNLCNYVWTTAIDQAARERKLSVMLVGSNGNMSASYDGLELLPELFLKGRFIQWWREAGAFAKWRSHRRRSAVVVNTFGPFMPVWLWRRVEKRLYGHHSDVFEYTAIRCERLTELGLVARARARDLDFAFRPWADGFAMRLWGMCSFDFGDQNKGTLAVDWRDPLADKRLVEYCLSIPTEEYLANGVPRALARRAFSDRLPRAVLNERKKGHQAADWHEGLTAARLEVAAEVDRFAAGTPAARALDVSKMRSLVENWPISGWGGGEERRYRQALLRGISAGHFLRKTSGANR
jgi:asparagine synthase (glutamine-hydrolysing)